MGREKGMSVRRRGKEVEIEEGRREGRWMAGS